MLCHQIFRSVIQETPGCDYWTDSNTNDWFRRRRNKKSQPLESTNVKRERELHLLPNLLALISLIHTASETILEDALLNLTVLIRNQPNPSPEVVKTWAALLASSNAAVQMGMQDVPLDTWIAFVQRIIQSSALAPAIPPTPAETVISKSHLQDSPSVAFPTSSSLNKMKHDPLISPVLPPLSISSRGDTTRKSPVVSLPDLPVPCGELQSPQLCTPLIENIKEAFSIQALPSGDVSPPINAHEFETMFAPYEEKLTRLLHILQDIS